LTTIFWMKTRPFFPAIHDEAIAAALPAFDAHFCLTALALALPRLPRRPARCVGVRIEYVALPCFVFDLSARFAGAALAAYRALWSVSGCACALELDPADAEGFLFLFVGQIGAELAFREASAIAWMQAGALRVAP
jgi:hypothetical protein